MSKLYVLALVKNVIIFFATMEVSQEFFLKIAFK